MPAESLHSGTASLTTGADSNEVISPRAAAESVRAAVGSWAGITAHDHRFGGIEFRLGRRELGHLHRTIADLPFPRRIRDELIAEGRARPHHVLPQSGWVTVPMRTASEIANVIALFQKSYERAVAARVDM
jgi:Luciferase